MSALQTPAPTEAASEIQKSISLVDFIGDFFNNPITTLVLSIFGVVGTVVGIKSLRDQRRTSKSYERLLKKAFTDYEGEFAEDQVNALKTKAKQLSDEISLRMPLEAHKALIMNKADMLRSEIVSLYNQHRSLIKQYKNLLSDSDISPEIKKYIDTELKRGIGKNRWLQSPGLLSAVSILILIAIMGSRVGVQYINDFIYLTQANIDYDMVVHFVVGLCGVFLIIVLFCLRHIIRIVMMNARIALLISAVMFLASIYVVVDVSYDLIIPTQFQMISGAATIITIPISFITVFISIDNCKRKNDLPLGDLDTSDLDDK